MNRTTILFDHQAFEMQRFGGISRYFCELIKELHSNNRMALFCSTNYYLHQDAALSQGFYIPERPYKWLKGITKKINQRNSSKQLLTGDYDLFHPTYYHPYFLPLLNEKPYVITVHDMNHELFSSSLKFSERMISWKKEVINHASRIIAISQNTKKDLISILDVPEEKIDVIYHGIDQIRHLEPTNLRLPEDYILYVGERSGYKNFDRLMTAFQMLAEEDRKLHLICTGRKFNTLELKKIEQAGLQRRIHCFRVSEQELRQLYRQARLFVYPSLYEGFGIPILESFINECPIALSNASCFPEIAGKAGEYFDANDIESIYETLRALFHNEERRKELIHLGNERVKNFTWEQTARLTEQTYLHCLQHQHL